MGVVAHEAPGVYFNIQLTSITDESFQKKPPVFVVLEYVEQTNTTLKHVIEP